MAIGTGYTDKTLTAGEVKHIVRDGLGSALDPRARHRRI